MRRIAMSLSITFGLCLAATAAARAEGPSESGAVAVCTPDYQQLVAKLHENYSEVPVSAGLGQDGSLVSIFAAPKSGSWTMVMTKPAGPSCIVAAGRSWQTNPLANDPEA